MSSCPRCHQVVAPQAITCPHCNCVLKAYGHPGMTLHRAAAGDYLCKTCVYDADDTCTFPQRPYATECTLYRDQTRPPSTIPTQAGRRFNPRAWISRNLVWIVLLTIVLLAIFFAR